MIAPNHDGIPADIRSLLRFVLWRIVTRGGGRPTKEPYQSDGRHADVSKPSTWCDFETALAAYQRGGFDGIGVMLGDGLTGIDLDGCRNPQTGEIDPWAQKTIDLFPSYAEVSPTGTGVKIFLRGRFPTEKTGAKTGKHNRPAGIGYGGKEPGIEAYHERRYFAMTGLRLASAPEKVCEFNGELANWYTETFGKPQRQDSRSSAQRKCDETFVIERAKAYLEKVPIAESGKRGHNRAYRAACILRCEFGLSFDGAWQAILDWNKTCLPPWSEKELRHKLEDAGKEPVTNRLRDAELPYDDSEQRDIDAADASINGELAERDQTGDEPVKPPPLTAHDLTDIGNARRFAREHGADVRYCHPWQKWLIWDGKRWKADDTGDIFARAKRSALNQFKMPELENDSQRKALLKWAEKSCSAERIRAAISLAQSEPGIPVLPAELDADHFLMNCANGILDLRTGILATHDRAKFITKLCPTNYNLEFNSGDFDQFLNAIFGGKQPIIDFVQRFFGYCLTGDVREHLLPIFWGMGSNGKTTLINAVAETIGEDYAIRLDKGVVVVKKNEGHSTERMDLHGKRLAICSETSDGNRLEESFVKDLTGGDTIRGRRMREDSWQYKPTHKIILPTNHKPIIRGTDHAIWRRLALVPFTVQFWDADKGQTGAPELKADKTLEDKLKAQAESILAWAVSGCMAWQRDGLKIPAEVRAATESYRESQDVLGMFLAERCIIAQGREVNASQLYTAYRYFVETSAEVPVTQRRFGEAMTERGFARKHSGGTKYVGLTLGSVS
jgi:putative DNA primase/helicase